MLYKAKLLNKFVRLLFGNTKNIFTKISEENNIVTVTLNGFFENSTYEVSASRRYNPKLKKSRAYNIGLSESEVIGKILEAYISNILTNKKVTNSFIENIKYKLFDENSIKKPIYCMSSGLDKLLRSSIFSKKQRSRIINIIKKVAKNINKNEEVSIYHYYKKELLERANYLKQLEKEQIQFNACKKEATINTT